MKLGKLYKTINVVGFDCMGKRCVLPRDEVLMLIGIEKSNREIWDTHIHILYNAKHYDRQIDMTSFDAWFEEIQ